MGQSLRVSPRCTRSGTLGELVLLEDNKRSNVRFQRQDVGLRQ